MGPAHVGVDVSGGQAWVLHAGGCRPPLINYSTVAASQWVAAPVWLRLQPAHHIHQEQGGGAHHGIWMHPLTLDGGHLDRWEKWFQAHGLRHIALTMYTPGAHTTPVLRSQCHGTGPHAHWHLAELSSSG